MGRSRLDGARWARIARRGGTDPSVAGEDAQYLTVDPTSGALIVQGAGAAPTATSLRVQDGDTTRTAIVGEDRALLVRDVTAAEATVDPGNFPATALAAGEMFTGAWRDVLPYAAITVVVLVDVASAAGGAVVDFSTDGINVVRSVSASIPANVGSYFSLAPEARFYRLRYTNGATAMTAPPRGQVLLRFQPPALVEQPLGASITDLNLAQITRSVTAGRLPDGRYLAVAVTADQRLLVSNQHAQALTDAQLRATPVPVTFLPDEAGLTDAELRAAPVPVATPAGLATDAALVPLLDGVEGLLAVIRDELLPLSYTSGGRLRTETVEPPFRARYGEVSVAAGTFTTVAEVTPAAEFTVVGYGADVASLTNINYRQRLVRLDAAGLVLETFHMAVTAANAQAWTPVHVTLPAGTRVAVQALHGELTAQTFAATLNHRER
jgi:hypothetical protein